MASEFADSDLPKGRQTSRAVVAVFWILPALLTLGIPLARLLSQEQRPEQENRVVLPPIPSTEEMAQTLLQESVRETMERLGGHKDDPYDYFLQAGQLLGVRGQPDTQFGSVADPVPRSHLVRKILWQLHDDNYVIRKGVASRLRQILSESLSGYFELAVKEDALNLEDINTGKLSPDDREVLRRIYSTKLRTRSAAYLLVELGDFGSLPILLRYFRHEQDNPEVHIRIRRPPIPRVFTFALMHELVCDHPLESLSPESVQLRNDYLALTKTLPRATIVEMPDWRKDINWDFGGMVPLDANNPVDKAKIGLHVYHKEFRRLEMPGGYPRPEVEPLIQSLEKFIHSAYPPDGKSK